MKLLKNLAIFLVAVAISFGFSSVVSATAAPDSSSVGPVIHENIQKDQPTPFWMRTPCEYEDSVNCYWDAGSRGNHVGHSFYVRAVPGKGNLVCVMYTQKAYARAHDNCSSSDENPY